MHLLLFISISTSRTDESDDAVVEERSKQYSQVLAENLKLRSDIILMKDTIKTYQTEMRVIKKSLTLAKKHNASLKRQLKTRFESDKRMIELEKLLTLYSEGISSFKEKFRPPQSKLELLRDPNRYKNCWTRKDMAEALKLYDCSPAAYDLLRKKDFPFPSVSTVKAWKDWKQVYSGTIISELAAEPRPKILRNAHSDYNSNNDVDESIMSDDEDVMYVPNKIVTVSLDSEEEPEHDAAKEKRQSYNHLERYRNIKQEELDIEVDLQHMSGTNQDEVPEVGWIGGECKQECKGELYSKKSKFYHFGFIAEEPPITISEDYTKVFDL